LLHYLSVDSRAPIVPLDESDRREFYKVMVAFSVFGEEYEVGIVSWCSLRFFTGVPGAESHICLESEDRANPGGFGLFIKEPTCVEITVIGDRQAVLAEALYVGNKIRDPIGAVQQRKLGVSVEVGETHALLKLSRSASSRIAALVNEPIKRSKLL
jgi:hypothetical protein